MTSNQQMQIEIHSALGPNTALLLNDRMCTFHDIYLLQSGKDLPIYALNDNGTMINSRMIQIPQEIFAPQIYEVGFQNGLKIQCSSETTILTKEGWKQVSDIDFEKMSIVELIFSEETGIQVQETKVEFCKLNIDIISIPLYTFIAQHGNILLPQINESENYISFIPVRQ